MTTTGSAARHGATQKTIVTANAQVFFPFFHFLSFPFRVFFLLFLFFLFSFLTPHNTQHTPPQTRTNQEPQQAEPQADVQSGVLERHEDATDYFPGTKSHRQHPWPWSSCLPEG